MSPVCPSTTTSGMPPAAVPTTALPASSASASTRPSPSACPRDTSAVTVAAPYSAAGHAADEGRPGHDAPDPALHRERARRGSSGPAPMMRRPHTRRAREAARSRRSARPRPWTRSDSPRTARERATPWRPPHRPRTSQCRAAWASPTPCPRPSAGSGARAREKFRRGRHADARRITAARACARSDPRAAEHRCHGRSRRTERRGCSRSIRRASTSARAYVRLEARSLARGHGPESRDEWRKHERREHGRAQRLPERPGIAHSLERIGPVPRAHDRHTVLRLAEDSARRVRGHDVHRVTEGHDLRCEPGDEGPALSPSHRG